MRSPTQAGRAGWRTPLVVLLIALMTLGLSACGGDDDGSASDTQPAQTEASGSDGVSAGDLAAATAKLLVVRRLLNKRQAKVEALEAEVEKANAAADQANADAKAAQADAEAAKQDADHAAEQASSASDTEKAQAEAEQAQADAKAAEAAAKEAEAQSREFAAKAEAAAGCAKAILEIVAKVPSAPSLEEGVQQAADDLEALAPKCEDALADAEG